MRFIDATENECFKQEAQRLVIRAKAEVEKLRSQFSNLKAGIQYYRDSGCQAGWQDYYHGVLLALGGDVAGAKAAFESVCNLRAEIGWVKALAQRASELQKLASDHTAFVETIRGIVLRTRSIGHLPEWESDITFR